MGTTYYATMPVFNHKPCQASLPSSSPEYIGSKPRPLGPLAIEIPSSHCCTRIAYSSPWLFAPRSSHLRRWPLHGWPHSHWISQALWHIRSLCACHADHNMGAKDAFQAKKALALPVWSQHQTLYSGNMTSFMITASTNSKPNRHTS